MTRPRRAWLAWAGVGLALLLGGIYVSYLRDMHDIRARLTSQSQVISTQHGAIEFASWGSGPAVLVLHGAGGGYDQGRVLAQAVGGAGFRWVSPSRFGYLRTPLPADVSTAAQADALADLLDALKIERVAVLAMSGGVPPALQFAARHPTRTSALVLLSSAPYAPLAAPEAERSVPTWVYEMLFASDFPFWALDKAARRGLERIFDVSPTLQASMPQADRVFVSNMLDVFLPVTKRLAGVRNEGAAVDPQAVIRLQDITAATLVIHAQDDGINPFSIGQYTASHIRGANFLPLTTGGHLLLGDLSALSARIETFLNTHIRVE